MPQENTKKDAATGIGKPLYFTFHGCLLAGTPSDTQGCFDPHLDNGVTDDGTPVIDVYKEANIGILPDGYVDNAADCSNLSDPGFYQTDEYLNNIYKYMPCIDFKIIEPFDRDRYKNYYDNPNQLDFGTDPYGSFTCGYGN